MVKTTNRSAVGPLIGRDPNWLGSQTDIVPPMAAAAHPDPTPTERTAARFPEIDRGTDHYESFYLRAAHPSKPLGVWIRHTIHMPPDEPPTGSAWFTLFDGDANEPVFAVKQTVGEAGIGAGEGDYIRVGDTLMRPGRDEGRATGLGRNASWALAFEQGEPPLRHLKQWMYGAPVPRTKLLSPHPAASFSGTVEAGGRSVELDGWAGMVGHNWGSQHAERWIWMNGAGFEGRGRDTWIDCGIGRIKVGPLVVPWIANGVLSLDGERHALGGPERVRATRIDERPDGARFVLNGDGIRVEGTVGAPRERFVGWVYADPDGSEHNTVNCSIADMRLHVSLNGGAPLELVSPAGATYELGMRERDHGMEIQPFPDGGPVA